MRIDSLLITHSFTANLLTEPTVSTGHATVSMHTADHDSRSSSSPQVRLWWRLHPQWSKQAAAPHSKTAHGVDLVSKSAFSPSHRTAGGQVSTEGAANASASGIAPWLLNTRMRMRRANRMGTVTLPMVVVVVHHQSSTTAWASWAQMAIPTLPSCPTRRSSCTGSSSGRRTARWALCRRE